MYTRYEQIVNVENIATPKGALELPGIIAFAEKETLPPVTEDTKKILLLNVDMQNDFMEGGNLAVPGSRKDIEHLTHFIYNNLDKISQIMCSLDIHSIAQIFHPYWWKDENGNHPKPYTVIPYDDVQQGKWKPVCGETARSLEYLKNIEKNGKRQLCIWPYHCLAGSFGASLEFEFTKMLYFHSVSRNSKPLFIQKGTDPYSEMYGIIKAEYDPTNFINIQVLNAIEKSDEIYIAGEAASHCLMDSAEQIFEYFAERPDITQKITILEDCTSPIAGFEQATIDTFEFFKTQYGVKIAKSTEIQL